MSWVDNNDHDFEEPPRSPSMSPVRNRSSPTTLPSAAHHEDNARSRKKRAKDVVMSESDDKGKVRIVIIISISTTQCI